MALSMELSVLGSHSTAPQTAGWAAVRVLPPAQAVPCLSVLPLVWPTMLWYQSHTYLAWSKVPVSLPTYSPLPTESWARL